VKKIQTPGLNFLIDKLTNSVENVVTGDSFQTEVSLVSTADLKNVTKRNKWLFDRKFEHKQPEREVYKLTISGNPTVIQGLISIEVKTDHVYMHLVENAPFIRAKQKCIQVLQQTLELLLADFHFSVGMKAMFHFFPNLNS
jgi:hypothetical protein